jgi:trehalose-phosphatase
LNSAPVGDALTNALRERFGRERAAIFLDVDGTLAPIAPTPGEATVPAPTRERVAELASTDGTTVALVSGRAAADAGRLVGIDGLWVVGNHGMELLAPDGTLSPDERITPWMGPIREVVPEAERIASRWSGVFVEDKQWTLSVHHRLASDEDGAAATEALRELAEERGLRMTLGKQVVELRPPIDVHKGTALVALARQLAGPQLDAALLYAGDDRTDEDAFVELRAAAPWAVTIRVCSTDERKPATFAEFEVADVAGMADVLGLLVEIRRAV